MVETIAEEVPEPHSSLYFSGSSLSGIASTVPSAHFEFSQAHEPQVHIADWEEDAGGEVMHRYYALWKEALDIVQQSKQGWIPTSSFKPPQDPVAIQAFYDYSDLSPVPYGNRMPKKHTPTRLPHHSETMEQAFACISPPYLQLSPDFAFCH
ncbi:hypothetical protein BS47DRAFT_1452168 [Hydnum rufescens UP504]|uniref:Uncharacterized protein n=1 Tax=Hydnum rufescens UP504 TaxID=1448309 RepID=A0A9P6AZS4_9AGAM|nr:hypothetical protein BS47DRAFT_1452168 [Hydnum rufescens UP504]